MVAHWVRRWIDGCLNREARKGRARAEGPQPRLELLEDRTLLSGGVSPALPVTAPTPIPMFVQQTIVEANGKILEVGTASDANTGGSEFAVAQFNPDGSLNTSFGSGGMVVTSLGNTDDVTDALVQPDGKIVVAGQAESISSAASPGAPGEVTLPLEVISPYGALVRYNPDGSLDTSFGNGGEVEDSFGCAIFDAVALQSDGKLVVDGPAFTVARYNSDGSLDTGFGQGGYSQLAFGNADSTDGLSIQPDGTILLTGYAADTSEITPLSQEWYQDEAQIGQLSGATIELTPPPAGWFPSGWYSEGSDWYTSRMASVQFNPDGSLDASFGVNGVLLSPTPPGSPNAPVASAPPTPVLPIAPASGDPVQTPTQGNGVANALQASSVQSQALSAASAGPQFFLAPTVPTAPVGLPALVIGAGSPIQAPLFSAAFGGLSGAYRSGGDATAPDDQTTDFFSLPGADAPVNNEAGTLDADFARLLPGVDPAGPNAVLDYIFALAPLESEAGPLKTTNPGKLPAAVAPSPERLALAPAPTSGPTDGAWRHRLSAVGAVGLGFFGATLFCVPVDNARRRRKRATVH